MDELYYDCDECDHGDDDNDELCDECTTPPHRGSNFKPLSQEKIDRQLRLQKIRNSIIDFQSSVSIKPWMEDIEEVAEALNEGILTIEDLDDFAQAMKVHIKSMKELHAYTGSNGETILVGTKTVGA